jgi:hypothetical protein
MRELIRWHKNYSTSKAFLHWNRDGVTALRSKRLFKRPTLDPAGLLWWGCAVQQPLPNLSIELYVPNSGYLRFLGRCQRLPLRMGRRSF